MVPATGGEHLGFRFAAMPSVTVRRSLISGHMDHQRFTIVTHGSEVAADRVLGRRLLEQGSIHGHRKDSGSLTFGDSLDHFALH